MSCGKINLFLSFSVLACLSCFPILPAFKSYFMDEKLLKPKTEKFVLGIWGGGLLLKIYKFLATFPFLLANYQSSLSAPAHEYICNDTHHINENTFKNANYSCPIDCKGHTSVQHLQLTAAGIAPTRPCRARPFSLTPTQLPTETQDGNLVAVEAVMVT